MEGGVHRTSSDGAGASAAAAAAPAAPADLLAVPEPDFLAAVRELMRPLHAPSSSSPHRTCPASGLVSLEARWAAAARGDELGGRGGAPALLATTKGAKAARALLGPFSAARCSWPDARGAQRLPGASAAVPARRAAPAYDPVEPLEPLQASAQTGGAAAVAGDGLSLCG
ncbi:hypothetical protein WJX81_001746 [Elliptochloris bilobata]|uniref:Uncharacterized protein n=1 Tax=Elliptochloris bilobata TaxID=381761 RepID=A0AAW1R1V3_9CHLO